MYSQPGTYSRTIQPSLSEKSWVYLCQLLVGYTSPPTSASKVQSDPVANSANIICLSGPARYHGQTVSRDLTSSTPSWPPGLILTGRHVSRQSPRQFREKQTATQWSQQNNVVSVVAVYATLFGQQAHGSKSISASALSAINISVNADQNNSQNGSKNRFSGNFGRNV